MYEANKARIDAIRRRFDEEISARSTSAEDTAREYLDALTDFVDEYNHGPGADPRLVGLDTTGQLGRTEDEVHWAEDERRRVRQVLNDLR